VITAGLDVGALFTKAVVVTEEAIAGWALAPTGESIVDTAESALLQALNAGCVSRGNLQMIVATGAGKKEVPFAGAQAAEVLCAARGIRFVRPGVAGVLDLGGESTRVAKLDERGGVLEFALNDKCAAGTGIFLDAMALVLGIPVEQMGALALESSAAVSITSTCVVFAESEVVSQVHRQTPKKDILRGIHKSIAARVFGLANRIGLAGDAAAIGGLACNAGIIACLEELMGRKIHVPENPQIVCALGAALIAAAKGNLS
jgi:predicted CoA-substrate-specific enzyme activase